MPSTFSSINEAQGAAVPQFRQTEPVVGHGGEGVISAAALGASLFQQATQFGQQKAQAEGQTAVGSLQTKLAKIRQAGATDSSINVVDQQRLALTEFTTQNPSLAQDAFKAFKGATGTNPAGLSVQEKAEIDLDNEAIKNGHGYHGADPVYQDKMTQHYVDLKRQDATLSRQVAKMNAEVVAGNLHKSALRDTVHAGARDMFATSADKTNDEMSDIEARYANGTLSLDEALMMTTLAANNVNREVASLGEFATDPVIAVYSQPTLDRIKLSVDILNGKYETDALTTIMSRNETVAKAKMLADPKVLSLKIVSETFKNVPGIQSQITSAAVGVLLSGQLDAGEMLPHKPKPVNFQNLDSGEQSVVAGTLESMFGVDLGGGMSGHLDRSIEVAKAEASRTITGIAEYVNRNGDLISKDDINFHVKLLNIPGAFEALDQEQKGVVMQGMNTYVADVVDVAARESIVQAEIQVTDPRKFEGVNFLSANTREKKPASEVADLVIGEGVIYWKLKPAYAGLPKAQSDVRRLNKGIADNITPSVNVNSKGLGVTFEEAAGVVFPIDKGEKAEGGKEEPAGKPSKEEKATKAPARAKTRLEKHIEVREGRRERSYKDTLGNLTGGVGHLMSTEEIAQYPEGSEIPAEVVDTWLEEDLGKAKVAASEQAGQIEGSTTEFEDALTSMNFQLGTNWMDKFPTAWQRMKEGDFISAAHELEFTSEGSGVKSDWYKQTPVRVKDMKKALVKLEGGKQ